MCEVTTLTAFAYAIWRKKGSGGDYTLEGVRVSSAGSQHLTVVLCVRPCSQTTTLSYFAKGGSFFAAAFSAGERAPSETIERYAFLRVHRARTPVHGARKAKFFHRIRYHLLVTRGKRGIGGLRVMGAAFFGV